MSTNRIVVITGANSGIGKAAARQFAAAGHTVIMACRSVERGEPVRSAIIEETGNHLVELMALDTSSMESIRAFSDAYRERYPRLDILIHNAAYFNHGEPFRLGPDGVEITFSQMSWARSC
jgi:NAD(P)-dependent dehydrogenase (short-subunit alcohol dehydrogenase family)